MRGNGVSLGRSRRTCAGVAMGGGCLGEAKTIMLTSQDISNPAMMDTAVLDVLDLWRLLRFAPNGPQALGLQGIQVILPCAMDRTCCIDE